MRTPSAIYPLSPHFPRPFGTTDTHTSAHTRTSAHSRGCVSQRKDPCTRHAHPHKHTHTHWLYPYRRELHALPQARDHSVGPEHSAMCAEEALKHGACKKGTTEEGRGVGARINMRAECSQLFDNQETRPITQRRSPSWFLSDRQRGTLASCGMCEWVASVRQQGNKTENTTTFFFMVNEKQAAGHTIFCVKRVRTHLRTRRQRTRWKGPAPSPRISGTHGGPHWRAPADRGANARVRAPYARARVLFPPSPFLPPSLAYPEFQHHV